ncbi:MAG: 30S ribosomal protein S6 [Candidatus Saccharibacteria bacterium]|nr:30S ribosomal protein S6 [Candidatus Saccharibacteria bacterium]
MSQATSRYEMVVLFRPEFEAKMDGPLKTIADLVAANGGEIVSEDDWGRKELAYKIAGETHAIYRVYQLELPTTAPAKIDATLNITDSVIRHLVTKVDEKVEQVLAEEKKAREAREAARADRDAE